MASSEPTTNERPAFRDLFARAILVGLALGLCVIGLAENLSRFSTPEGLAESHQASDAASGGQPLTTGPAAAEPLPREDRLDISMASPPRALAEPLQR
ncbi:MAG: hypothetical protein KI785_00075 [Devosiaceae bacterium]|nr:hypothetical protein [Devosiaceae bacterium MH13]